MHLLPGIQLHQGSNETGYDALSLPLSVSPFLCEPLLEH